MPPRTSALDSLEKIRAGARYAKDTLGNKLGHAYVEDEIQLALAALLRQPFARKASPLRPPILFGNQVRYVAWDTGRFRLWEKTGIVYDIDPDIWRELGTLKPDQKVWTSTFRNIRHPNPFIHFPEPIRLGSPANKEESTDLLGIFLTGYHTDANGQRLARSLTVPNLDGIALNLVGVLYDADGEPLMMRDEDNNELKIQQVLWQTLSVDFQNEPITLAELVQKSLDRYVVLEPEGHEVGDRHQYMRELLAKTMALLMYLGTSNLDIEEVSSPAPRKKKANQQKKPTVRKFKIGYRVGEKIRLFHTRVRTLAERTKSSAATPSGRKPPRPYMMPPFVRGYWCKLTGCTCLTKNPEEHIETRFINGYWASVDRLFEGEAAQVVVHSITE